MPMYDYRWKNKPDRGIGPTAQAFHSAFPNLEGAWKINMPIVDGSGRTRTEHMATYPVSDAIGVALAATKHLINRVERLVVDTDADTMDLNERVKDLEDLVDILFKRLAPPA